VKAKYWKLFGLTSTAAGEQEAWRSLADMWPALDVDRIRAAILNARARGIRAQVDGFVVNGNSQWAGNSREDLRCDNHRGSNARSYAQRP